MEFGRQCAFRGRITGKKMSSQEQHVNWLQSQLHQTQKKMRMIRAKYEAAQNYATTENHWSKADYLSPDAANDPFVRARLRARSRFEIIENNPYLNGTMISLCNDFAGSGCRLTITDTDVPRGERQKIEKQFRRWQKRIKLRKLLWRLRMDKAVSGEAFAVAIYNKRLKHPVKLDYRVIEADCVTSPTGGLGKGMKPLINRTISPSEADGIKLDEYGNPISYHFLDYHPGGSGLWEEKASAGKWIPAEQVIHIYRQLRAWHRGIPELTPSLPLCAVARRYTMALVRCAEIQASLSAVLESDIPTWRNTMAPPTRTVEILDEDGKVVGTEQVTDDEQDLGWMGDSLPIEMGTMNLLPQGMKMKMFNSVPIGQQYDLFIGALMRDIFRPILVPYNVGIGSSKDSNMASGVLDAGIYTKGQESERYVFEEDVLSPIIDSWYLQGCLTDGYFTERGTMPIAKREIPDYKIGWDKVTIEHTDPTKVAKAITTMKEPGIYTDRHIQEELIGSDYEDLQDQMLEEAKFRRKLREITGITVNDSTQDTQKQEDEEEDEDDEE